MSRPVRAAVAKAKPIDFDFNFPTGASDSEPSENGDADSEAGVGASYAAPADDEGYDEEEEEEEDVKPKIATPKRKIAPLPHTPPSSPPQKKVKKEPTSPNSKPAKEKVQRGNNGGDKFVATAAIRKAMTEEVIRNVPASSMNWGNVVAAAGEGTEKQVAKYFTQTFKKHLITSAASSSFGGKSS